MKILTSFLCIIFSTILLAQEENKAYIEPKPTHVIYDCVATYSDYYNEITTTAKDEDVKKAASKAKNKILYEIKYPKGSPSDYIEASKVYCKSDVYKEIK